MAGGNLVEFLGQDETPLHFWGDSLKGKKVEALFLKDGNIPELRSKENFDLNIVQTIVKRQLESRETDKWNRIVNKCMVVSEENSTEVHHMYTMRTVTN